MTHTQRCVYHQNGGRQAHQKRLKKGVAQDGIVEVAILQGGALTSANTSPNPKTEKEPIMHFHMTVKSRNVKTGPIPVTTSTAATCPDSCPLKKAGCYADAGPLGMFWKKVTEGRAGESFDALADKIAALPLGQLWRHNQSGDLVPDANRPENIDAPKLAQLVAANKGKRGFTYTHYDVINSMPNRKAVADANRKGFTVNLSANNLDHADDLAQTDCGPVASVLPLDYQRTTEKAPQGGKQWAESLEAYKARMVDLGLRTPQGRRVTICPATYSDDVSCATCKLCQKVKRPAIVGFPAHGVSKRKASAIAETVPAYAIAAE